MYTGIEYISAAVIASFIALLLFAVQLRSQEATIDSSHYRAAKTSAIEFVRMIERDMKNLGAQHPSTAGTTSPYPLPGAAPFAIPAPPDSLSSPRTFEFYAQPNRGVAPSTIRYEWEQAGTVTLADGSTKPTYHLERYVDGNLEGRSLETITEFSIWLLEHDGNAITNVDETRQVFVEIRSVSPFGKGETVEETRWSSVFRPPALTIEQ